MSIREGRPASGVTAATLREMNIRTVWSVIEGGHPISRAEIARLRLPYPPRLEVSALGDSAVLTGAAAVAASVAVEQVIRERTG